MRSESKGTNVKRIYKGNGPTDPWLVKHWLEQNGLHPVVQGQQLMGLVGEIPLADAWPTVWVPSDEEERALELVDRFNGPTLVHPVWQCPKCDETSPPNFEQCWNCDATRPE